MPLRGLQLNWLGMGNAPGGGTIFWVRATPEHGDAIVLPALRCEEDALRQLAGRVRAAQRQGAVRDGAGAAEVPPALVALASRSTKVPEA